MEDELSEKERKERELWKSHKAEAASVRAMWHGMLDTLLRAGCPLPVWSPVRQWFEERIEKAR